MKERNHTNVDSVKSMSMKKRKYSNVVFAIQNLVRAPKLQFMKKYKKFSSCEGIKKRKHSNVVY